jgi:hypothetical protein
MTPAVSEEMLVRADMAWCQAVQNLKPHKECLRAALSAALPLEGVEHPILNPELWKGRVHNCLVCGGSGEFRCGPCPGCAEWPLATPAGPSAAPGEDDPMCTDCHGTGITDQTERRCACQGPALTSPSAEAAQPVANSYTARNHLLSLVDSSNWPDMKGDYFKGYSDAMEIVNEAVLDCWDELKFEAGKPPSQPQGELREGMVLVPEAALKWLFGEGPDADGNWFGDGPAHATGAFWWRTPFRAWIDAGRTAG